MHAMMLHDSAPIETEPLRLVELPDPQPGPGELRLRVHCCAVCRTDLHVIEGDLPPARRPVIPGHQIVGRVDVLGENCTQFKIGDRVGVAWLHETDGSCRFCTTGRENLCPNSRYTGYHVDGGYAQFAIVPEAFAYPIPDAFSDEKAAPLLCAGIVGYRAYKRANLPPNGRLLIIGFGSSAHIIAQIALHHQHELYVVTRSPAHQELARQLGARWAGERFDDLPHRVDSAILFAPSGKLVPPALESLERGGTLALAGIHMTDVPSLNYAQHLFNERDIHPVTANTREDGRELLAEAAAARVDPHITHYDLADANRALADVKHSRIDGTAVLRIA